jgi:hypothetical protein
MHILIVTGVGLLALAVVWFGTRMAGRSAGAAASLFVLIWFVTAVTNGIVGVMRAGIPLINEIGAFMPIFGIPVVLAWYLAHRSGPGHRAD